MGEKDHALVPARAGKAGLHSLAEQMRGVHISRVSEMPRIELYLDQVLTLVSQELAFMSLPGETLLTGSMVNNYVKQGVIPAPRKKRYTRRHLAALVFVCALKRVFSIAQVKQLMGRIYASGLDTEALYDEACALFEHALAACFSEPESEAASDAVRFAAAVEEAGGDAELARLIESAVAALATKVYVEQTLLLEGAPR